LPIEELSPESLVARTKALLAASDQIKAQLDEALPGVRERARSAADHIASLLKTSRGNRNEHTR